ncbi:MULTISPECIES: glycosyltransferase [unclassified Mesorhizobium]|uniref:glycosyltransferase n=2 Tax=Mesorhizobium TaxID=68287 RepID=UPI001FE1E03A|nr:MULTISPECIES: glycosyltransferase [unclassified Mesorhizobium]MCT2579196.1 glycosyltransferase [Mesorhizobium sp. P13.3]MDF3168135.1 glycosyltransferase [Mesorhizobium sp. P16.1]MDF3180943.1 glycosyltransferase [Mesorhizobium sp. P17.1]MDF3185049.1 glycosyltransferase [Mesorhizobium sp. ICCV3110.1]
MAVLMGTRDGAAYIGDQLQSLLDQSWPHVDLWVSNDGSTDPTLAIIEAWRSRWNKGSLALVQGPRNGFAANFRSMIIEPRVDADYYAFCDQDDVWEPDRLESAIRWMSFRNALVQSIAGGNTMLFNRAARDLLAKASARTEFVSHDWWAYLVVTAAGGKVRYEPRPLVRYRQHGANLVGANVSWKARLSRLGRLFQGQFATWTDSNLRGLAANRDLVTRDAARCLRLFIRARKGSALRRFSLLGKSGVYRQTLMGTLGLYLAFLWRRI